MNKNLLAGGLVLVLLIAGFFIFSDKEESENLEQEVFSNTIDVSREYLELRILTDNTLTKASQYTDYNSWNKQMSALLTMWEKLDAEAVKLEDMAEDYSEEGLSLRFVNEANAVTKEEINDVFDKAPAGKKIRTLAKFLGVDAKRAYKILEQTQNEVKADAWNEAGDEFQKLETTAVVIKDGCKVAGFIGGVVISGGTSAIAAGSTLTQVAVVVTGADLVLEVSEDAANISMGNSNKVAAVIGDIRKFTEPAAAILSIADLPNNLASNFEKFNAFMFGLDQFRGAAQEGKVIGIALPVYEGKEMKIKIDGVVMNRDELEEWLEGQGYDDYDDYLDGLFGDEEGDEDEEDEDEEEEDEVDESADEEDEVGTDEETVSEEEVMITPETVYGKDGKMSISLESPLDATFWRGQARMWKLNIQNFDREKAGLSYACDWRFYIDGALHAEMLDNAPCHFTSTFLDKAGSLTAKVDLKLLQGRSVFDDNGEYVEYVKDVVETISLSQEYTIKAPVDTYVHP